MSAERDTTANGAPTSSHPAPVGESGTPRSESVFAETEPGRKGEILDAALDVFGEKGYDGGSMREIAARVGVSEPALYRHFPGKEAIFLALIRLGAGQLQREAISIISSMRPESLRVQMLAALRERRQAVHFYAPLLRTVLPAAARNARFMSEYRATIVEPVRSALVAKATEIDTAFGTIDADASRDARVRALAALLIGFMISSFVLADEPDQAIVDAALRVMGWEA